MTSSSLRFDHLQHQFEENPRRHFVPLANAFLRAGNARRAVELCRTFLPQLPGHVSGHVVLAEALQALGATDEARAEYERVLALDAENLVAVRALGEMAAARGNALEAHGWFARLVELDPRDADAAARLDALASAAGAPAAAPFETALRAELGASYDDEYDDAPYDPAAPEAVEPHAAFGAAEQEQAEEFTAGFFASVLGEPHEPARDDDARFASDLDHLLPADSLPGADELHATLSSSPRGEGSERDGGLRSLSSLPPFDDAPRLDEAPAAPEPAPFAHEEPEPFTPREASAEDERATPVGTPIMEEFPEDAAAAADLAAEPGHAFVTETMAELYLRQGFRTEALDVYRQLLAASPHDERLAALVAELSRPAAPTPEGPMAAVPEEIDLEPDASAGAAPEPETFALVDEPSEAAEPEPFVPAADEHAEPAAESAAAQADAPEAVHVDAEPEHDAEPHEEPHEEPASAFALGNGGMIEGVAGVDDRTWMLADEEPVETSEARESAEPTGAVAPGETSDAVDPGAAAAPTVAAWLSSLVAGEELPVALDAAAAPRIEEEAAPASRGADDVAVAEDAPEEAPAVAAERSTEVEPVLVAGPEPTIEPESRPEPELVVEEETTTQLAEHTWAVPAEGAEEPAVDLASTHDEPTVAWIEAEPEEIGEDLLIDLTATGVDEPDVPEAPELAIVEPEASEPAPAAAESGWPSWGADALLPDSDAPAAEVEVAEPGAEAYGAAEAEPQPRVEGEFAGTVAEETPLDDLVPLAAAGAGVAPAGDAPLSRDEIEGPTTAAVGAVWDDPFAWDEPGETPAAAPAAAEPFSLDALFALPADPADERAADTLAATTAGIGDEAAGRDAGPAGVGAPSGLDALLRATPPGVPVAGDAPAAPAAAEETPARGNAFSFEQFFRPTPAAGGPAAPPPPARPAPEPPAERDDDLDEFHRWLEGLSNS